MTILRLAPALRPGCLLVTCWRCLRDHDMASDEVRQDGPRGEFGDWACTDSDACDERAARNYEETESPGGTR